MGGTLFGVPARRGTSSNANPLAPPHFEDWAAGRKTVPKPPLFLFFVRVFSPFSGEARTIFPQRGLAFFLLAQELEERVRGVLFH